MPAKLFRSRRGQALVTMGIFTGVFVLLAIGMFTYEINRLTLARDQLRSAADAAALSGAAALASSDFQDAADAHSHAINTAINTFQQNRVLGISLSSAAQAYGPDDHPDANQSSLFIEFLDPHNDYQPVTVGDANGKIVRITAAFGMQPLFGKFFGVNNVPVLTVSSGGVPELDLALCFDVSGSIDDQTPVTFVRRQYNHTTKKIDYVIPATTSGSPAGTLAQGKIFDILGPPATGSAVQGVYPQGLSNTNTPTGNNDYPINFSENSGASGAAVGLRGTPNAGSPPGNYSKSGMSLGNSRTFTDLVVNIDGKNQFAGYTSPNGYNFPNIATLVEAARGNLENNTVFTNSKANVSVPSSVVPKTGYQAEYFEMCKTNLHPIYDAQIAAQHFLTIMNNNTDAHFSIISFTSEAGNTPSTTLNMYNVDPDYSNAGNQNFPNPLIPLNPADGMDKYSECYNILPTLRALSGTNIGDAANEAVKQLKNNCRQGSKKAIVLFTDGQPTSGGPLSSDPWTNARMAASAAKAAGIPIYTIGLAQNPQIIPGEVQILNDTNPNASNGGMAAIAGNGGKFFLVTKVENLRLTFENIARQLVQLTAHR